MEIEKKIISFVKKPQIIKFVYFLGCMVISFGLGVFTHKNHVEQNFSAIIELPAQPIPKLLQYTNRTLFNEFDELPAEEGIGAEKENLEQKFVASKSGTKYYPINCGSVSRIKEENKVYFSSTEEAESKGYGRAATCN